MNKELKQKYISGLQTVRQLINSFDPAGLISAGCPDDEFDVLNQQILSSVYSKKSLDDIKDLILIEVQDYYGSDLTVMDEPYKTKFYSDLDILLDKLAAITL